MKQENIFESLKKTKPVHQEIELLITEQTVISGMINYLKQNEVNSLCIEKFSLNDFVYLLDPTAPEGEVYL